MAGIVSFDRSALLRRAIFKLSTSLMSNQTRGRANRNLAVVARKEERVPREIYR